MAAPFDAGLLVAFGGPQGPADVRPFLANVLRGRRVAPERVEEVAHHYALFGGASPLTRPTHAHAGRPRRRRAAAGLRRDAQLASVSRRPAGRDVARGNPPRRRPDRRRSSQLFELPP